MEITQTAFEAIGTHWNIQIAETIESAKWSALQGQIHERIEQFDKAYSRFRADSLVAQISRRAGSYELPADAYKLLHFYEQLYRATNGKVTPLIGQTVADAGYDATYSLVGKADLRRPPRWEETLSYTSDSLTVKQPVLLDFGAAGKGYLVDIVGELIAAAGVKSYLINAGGDILYQGKQSLEVGLENPFDTSEAIGIVQLTGKQSLGASAGSKRKWQKYHHIIDPDALVSPKEIAATWVLAADTMTADGLATALFFAEPKALSSEFNFSYARLHSDMQLEQSQDFPAKLFTAGQHGNNR